MRKLAAGCFAFGLGIFLAVYLPNGGWILPTCVILCLLGVASLLVKSNKLTFARIICFCVAVGLLWSFCYDIICYKPAVSMDDTEGTASAKITDYPLDWKYGFKVDADILVDNRYISSVVYCHHEDISDLRPGDIVTFNGEFSLTDSIGEKRSLSAISKGYMLYAFTEEVTVTDHEDSIFNAPKTVAKAVKDKIDEIFPEDVSAFLKAMLVGDRTDFNEELSVTNALSDAGVYHILAVSGLHISFLAGMIYILFGRRKWTAAIIVPLLLFFMAMTGFTPSVTRAGIMQIFVVMAPVFNKDDDSITSLSVALAVILLSNPYAIAHAGLQMSFLATLGMLLITPKMSTSLIKAAKITKKKGRTLGRRIRDKILFFLISGFSSTVGALVLTMPLTALYFGNISLVAPISNMLILWAASFVFSFGLVVCAIGFIWMPLASVLAYPVIILVRYIMWIGTAIGNSGFAAVYTCNKFIVIWFIYVYILGMIFVLKKAKLRQAIIPICLSIILLCSVFLVTALDTDNKPMTFTALDVGQGQCIVMTSGEYTAVIDCGGSIGDVGNILGDYISSLGRSRIDVFVITHFDSDHCNGVDEAMERLDISSLIIPDPDKSDNDNAYEIVSLAEEKDIQMIYAETDMRINLGDSTLQVFAPLRESDENEMSLVSLMSCGTNDILVTGDIGSSTERILVREKSLPDIEVLVAGHHGSSKSTSMALLDTLTPETVVISVGENSYGHPSDEVLNRIAIVGAEVYRTDEMGNISISFNEE